MPSGCFHCLFFTGKRSFYNNYWDATGSSIIITLAQTLACVAGVKRGRGRGQFGRTREKGKRPMHSLAPKLPLPFPLSTPAMQGRLLKHMQKGQINVIS